MPSDAKGKGKLTFETKCWERDWRDLLCTGLLEAMIEAHQCSFDARALFINNVDDVNAVARAAEAKLRQGVLTEYYIVAEYSEVVLRFVGLSRESLGKGYYYSISELTALYLARTGYLLHCASDCILRSRSDWLSPAMQLMDLEPRIAVSNPSWTPDLSDVRKESLMKEGRYFFGYGFSDQMYLVRVSDFAKPIYHHTHPASERYPAYGGELFEKRVDAWMRTTGRYRATDATAVYAHHGFGPKWRNLVPF